MISQKGETTLFERLSTPRPAPKIVLKSDWHSQQQQPHTLEGSTSAGIGKPLRFLQPSTSTVVVTPASIGKPLREGFEPTEEKEEPEFEVDLRIEGIAQDAILKDEERMGNLKEVVGKLKIGCQPKRKSYRFDKKESQKIFEQGNIELHELGQISRTVQCNSCLKHLPDGLIFCECDMCLRPDSGTTDKLSIKFKAMIAPDYAAKMNCSRSKKHGEAQWQKDHWKAKDALRAAIKKGKESILQRWQEDEVYRESLAKHMWTESYRRYLDDISKIDISYTATYQQRLRYENTIALISNDHYQAGPLKNRTDYKCTTRALTSLQIQEGRQNTFIPKHERSRRRPIHEQLSADLEWRSQNWWTAWSTWQQLSSSSSTTPTWSWQEQDQTGEHTEWRNYERSDWQAQPWKSE